PFTSPAAEPSSPPAPTEKLEELFPGGRLETYEKQACFVVDRVYPLPHQHGLYPVGQLLDHAPQTAVPFIQDERLHELTFRDFLFIDTETTGLGGAGTLAFMVGVAYFEQDALVVRQYFLRDHADEAAMLPLLAQLLEEKSAVITFNGRSFDLPLLDNRYLMNRFDLPQGELRQRPHIDLLHPARRIWRQRLDSCSLSSLETHILGVQRTHEDVPGSLIPYLYNTYLREGDIRPLLRVFYHNQLDMLSMVTLTTRLLQLFDRPQEDEHHLDLLGLGRWQFDLGLVETAEQTLHLAKQRTLPVEDEQKILWQLATLLKKHNRRTEAVSLWEQIAIYSEENVDAHIELAKYYEWHETDLAQAINWTQQAIGLLDH
ncbi:MAG: ribonuclease H-like domain-containing protein, partial [Anaerolineales bacterium]|nr:ribonuclease H-like domain-containing protein [Anaerolineales bacterium]